MYQRYSLQITDFTSNLIINLKNINNEKAKELVEFNGATS